ncbi:MAG: MFS transporter [Candidatus Peribacteraceae bacterium]|nr:MFS transporter [Candidatus Peribacteraceae bacterium]
MSPRRNIRLLSWFNFFVNFEPLAPVAIIYFSHVTGSFTLGMSVFSISMLASAVFEVPTGVFSDMIGRKYTMTLGGIAGTLSILCYALATSFPLLAVGSVFEGLMMALYSGNNNAFLHDTLKEARQEEQYAHFLGRTSSLFQAGLGISALLGGVIAEYSLPLVLWIGVLPRFMCVLLSLFMREPKIHEKSDGNIFAHLAEALRNFKKNARLRTLSMASILDFGVGQAEWRFTPAFFQMFWPLWAIGLGRMLANLLACLSYWFSGRIIKRFKALPVLLTGKITSHTVAFIACGFPTVLSPLMISCTSIIYGMKSVAENSLLQREFTDRQRATMGSLNTFAGSLLHAVFAVCFGLVADSLGPAKPLLIVECILFSGVFLYWSVFRKERARA